jgi:thymidylate kinase
MKKHRNTFISLSGIDGCGKSTQLERLQDYFKSLKCKTIVLWTRGGYTPGINWLKNLTRKIAGNKLPPSGNSSHREQIIGKRWVQKLWLTIAMIDLMWIYGIQIRMWLRQGKVVICDRYLWDTLIDFQIMFPDTNTEKWFLCKALIWITPKPLVQCLLMIPIELSEKRCKQKYEPFPDTLERRSKRYTLYRNAMTKHEWVVIDATQPAEKVFADIIRLME